MAFLQLKMYSERNCYWDKDKIVNFSGRLGVSLQVHGKPTTLQIILNAPKNCVKKIVFLWNGKFLICAKNFLVV